MILLFIKLNKQRRNLHKFMKYKYFNSFICCRFSKYFNKLNFFLQYLYFKAYKTQDY